MRASGKRLPLKCGGSVLFKAGARRRKALQIPRWDSDQSRKAIRVKSSTGSYNARWRRELPGGDTEEPEADNFRGSAKKTQTVKSSTMRGAQALASKL